MATTSISDQVELLLERKVAEDKIKGVPSPDLEARAIFDSIALALIVKPKAVLYSAFLARNSFLNILTKEIEIIEELLECIEDLSNTSYLIDDLTDLNSAKNALLQLEQLTLINTSSNIYQRFDSSIDKFIEEKLGKSLKRANSTSLVRPSKEAAIDLAERFEALQDAHSQMLERLYALSVGVNNFVSSNIRTILGVAAVSRAKEEIQSIIESLGQDPSDASAREHLIRLLSARASIKAIGENPSIDDPLVSTDDELPVGYAVQAKTEDSSAEFTTSAGPFSLPTGSQVTVQVGLSTLGPFNFPQSVTFQLDNKACIVSDATTYPVVVPASSYLFVTREVAGVESHYKIPITAGSRTLAQVLADITSFAGTEVLPWTAAEFCKAGSTRIIISDSVADALSIESVYVDAVLGTVYDSTIHTLVGFEDGQRGESGSLSQDLAIDALNLLFSSLATATADGTAILLSTVIDDPGTSIIVTVPATLGTSGTYYAESDKVILFGTVNGEEVSEINPMDLVDIGDIVVTPYESESIAELTPTRITLADNVRTFNGDIEITSILNELYNSLETALTTFLSGSWTDSKFNENLNHLSIQMAGLSSSSTPAQMAATISSLNTLKSSLDSLLSILNNSSLDLPDNCATRERVIINDIINSLTERGYSKAIDHLLKCEVSEMLSLDYQSASFAGSLMQSMSDVAQNYMTFPSAAEDEGSEPRGREDD